MRKLLLLIKGDEKLLYATQSQDSNNKTEVNLIFGDPDEPHSRPPIRADVKLFMSDPPYMLQVEDIKYSLTLMSEEERRSFLHKLKAWFDL